MTKRVVLERVFGIDPRSIAALRIALGTILLVDLALRSCHFTAFYTDSGVLPFRVSSLPAVPLHALSGAYWYQASLFVLAAIFALSMLIGLYSRLATCLSWAFLMSLHGQNAMNGYFGDEILRQVLFWTMFVPTGRVWSLDAHRARGRDVGWTPELSIGTAGLLLQIASVYFFSGVLKTGADWWESGTAIAIALERDWLVRPLGVFLRENFGALLAYATPMVLAFEILGPLLLFCPIWTARLRVGLVSLSWIFQYGLGLSLFLGNMPWVNAAMMLAFVPPAFWNAIGKAPREVRDEVDPEDIQTPSPGYRRLTRIATESIAALCLAYVLAYNLLGLRENVTFPDSLERIGLWLRINQKWAMFGPISPREDGWYVIPGELKNGKFVNLWWTGPALSWDKPEWITDYHPSRRWSTYQMRLTEPLFEQPRWAHYRRRYAEWLCEEWNATHTGDEMLVRLEIVFMDERTRDDHSPPKPVPRRLAFLECEVGS